ncbi:WD40/YVTN/BNR-like repeat-containing protein [Thermaurantiacus sp.]
MRGVRALAASVGHGVWFSDDLGESWRRPHTHRSGLYNESRCWSLGLHPDRPGEFLAGTDQGLYRWRDADAAFHHIPSPMDGLHILKVARAPHDPGWIVCGTRPAALFASRDDGRNWQRLPFPGDPECAFINTPRVTSLLFDPLVPDRLWTTVEIDGLFRSDDGGATWLRCNEGLLTRDTHDLLIFDGCPAAGGGRLLLCSTEEGLHRSLDNGARWEPVEVPAAPFRYFRCMAARPDGSGTLFLSVGDRPSGDQGFLLRSRDFGTSWEEVALPGRTNTTIWWIATLAGRPDLLMANSIFGEIWRSEDGGETWTKPRKFLGEVREVALRPL